MLKLFNQGISRNTVETEARLTPNCPCHRIASAAVGEIHEIDGRFGLEYERIEGVSMLQAFMQTTVEISVFARQLAELQVEMNKCIPEMPSQRERLERKIMKQV